MVGKLDTYSLYKPLAIRMHAYYIRMYVVRGLIGNSFENIATQTLISYSYLRENHS